MNNTTLLETVVTEIHAPITASVIWLHGLGADGYDFADIVPQLQLPSALGIRFIFPHAPIRPVSINNGYAMRAWYDIYGLADFSQEDQVGMQTSQQSIIQLIEQQLNAGIDASRIILAGFSQGGALALYTGLRFPQKLAGILGLSTYLPLANLLPTQAHPINQATPIMLAHGTKDEIIPISLAERSRDALRHHGYSVQWQSYPMAHQVCAPEIADISHWLVNALKSH